MTTQLRGQTIITHGTNGAAVSTPLRAPPKVVRIITSDIVKTPHQLHQYLTDLSNRVDAVQRDLAADVFAHGALHRGLKFTASTPNYVQHRLGRPYMGYILTRVQSPSAPPTLWEVALPGQFPAATYVALEMTCTATVDVFIF